MDILLYVLLGLLILLLLVLGGYLTIGYLLYRGSLSRRAGYKVKIENKHKNNLNKINADDDYFKNNFKKVTIISEDKLTLCGFYKDNDKNKLALLVHGYGGSHFDMLDYAKLFEEKGYDILAIDLRAHGQSEGEYVGMGQLEKDDLKLWTDFASNLKSNYKIILFGVSLGASTICLTIGKNLSNQVVLAIEDCGFSNAEKQMKFVFSTTKLKGKFFFNIFTFYLKKTKNLDLKKIDVCSSLKKSKIPVMFIHGDSDKFVLTEDVFKMQECLPENRRKLFVSYGAGHIKSYITNPVQYKMEVFEFLDKFNM